MRFLELQLFENRFSEVVQILAMLLNFFLNGSDSSRLLSAF